jgi:hypothetical protein
MILRSIRAIIVCLIAIFGVACVSQAQSPIDPDKLPARTSFYVLWHGTPTGELRKKNSFFALWDDPDFASARASFVTSLTNSNPKDKNALTQEEAAQYATLLDNPFLFGYIRRPQSAPPAVKAVSQTTQTPPADKPLWNGVFLIYDRSGKEELLSKAVLRMRGSESEVPKLTNLTVAGVPALKIERKSGVNYWAEFSKYAVSAQELPVFEEIVGLLKGKAAPAALAGVASFNEAKPFLHRGLLEFFFNASNLKELAADSAPGGPTTQLKPFLNGLKLEALHCVAGNISLDGARTRMQGAILGDAAPGGLFDIFSEGQVTPASMSFVSSDTVYYSESQIDFVGVYKVIKRAIAQAGDQSAQQINAIELLAASRIGMPIDAALGLTSGEFASLQTSPGFAKDQQVYFLGIRNKPDLLKLAHTVASDRIASETNDGNTTFLKIALQGGQTDAGTVQSNFYYLALTPNALLASAKSDTLNSYLSHASVDPVPPKTLQSFRGQFPQKISGITYLDFQKVDWPALQAAWVADAKKAAATAKTPDTAKTNLSFSNWLSQTNPQVVPRHIHVLTGASWKDAQGVHFDESVE